MNESVTPSPNRAEAAASCCGPAPAVAPAEVAPAESSPCCGTGEGAEAAGACCEPQAKREAVARGAGCC
ncbi:hypothetical protein HYE82_01175 [Streptomyces sp. BR123]|uniref:hypothetical protein n=1 Tax=Streptomyces sp. BR123 TaxID=2749828 RepID=UPI0015C4A3B0|nr:hypothetical protein [Streptomyces sp. BR123]NXY93056.1 hypothetical protein [Streptomyces sp. BR123]